MWLEADALFASKGRGFGEAVGINGLTTVIPVPSPTNHLQLKVCQVAILTKEVCMGVDLI